MQKQKFIGPFFLLQNTFQFAVFTTSNYGVKTQVDRTDSTNTL